MHRNSSFQYDDVILPGSIEFTGEADPIVEPVSLVDTKGFLRIAGSVDDADVTKLIKAAREWVEKMTGLSLIPRVVSCTVQVNEFVELPYGPVTSTIANSSDSTVLYPVTKGSFPLFNQYGEYDVLYSTGYTPENIPENLKFAIICRVGATYENRGDKDEQNYSQMAKTYYRPYRRLMSWV